MIDYGAMLELDASRLGSLPRMDSGMATVLLLIKMGRLGAWGWRSPRYLPTHHDDRADIVSGGRLEPRIKTRAESNGETGEGERGQDPNGSQQHRPLAVVQEHGLVGHGGFMRVVPFHCTKQDLLEPSWRCPGCSSSSSVQALKPPVTDAQLPFVAGV